MPRFLQTSTHSVSRTIAPPFHCRGHSNNSKSTQAKALLWQLSWMAGRGGSKLAKTAAAGALLGGGEGGDRRGRGERGRAIKDKDVDCYRRLSALYFTCPGIYSDCGRMWTAGRLTPKGRRRHPILPYPTCRPPRPPNASRQTAPSVLSTLVHSLLSTRYPDEVAICLHRRHKLNG